MKKICTEKQFYFKKSNFSRNFLSWKNFIEKDDEENNWLKFTDFFLSNIIFILYRIAIPGGPDFYPNFIKKFYHFLHRIYFFYIGVQLQVSCTPRIFSLYYTYTKKLRGLTAGYIFIRIFHYTYT